MRLRPGLRGLSAAALGASAPAVTLDNASILDKSATLTRVGTLSNLTGTPTLTDDAGGRFVLRQNGSNYEICAGLVITDRAGATSHGITVTDSAGAHNLTITVTAITAATLTTGGSCQFPRRNGEVTANSLATSVGLYGVFGANVAGGEDGAIAFFFDVRRGSLVTQTTDQDINSSPYVLGTGGNTVSRGFAVRYFPEDASAASGTALKGRICIAGKDHGSANHIGKYLTTDADGAPSGGSSGAYLRSAVITDDIPRLFVLRYTASTKTFEVLTIRLSDFTVEAGDTNTLAAWVGIGISGTKTAALSIGTGTGLSSPALANFFPGRISDFLVVGGTSGTTNGSNTDWQNIAKGYAPSTVFGSNVRYHWTLSGPSDLTQTAGSQTSSSFTATGTIVQGQQMRPSINGSNNGLVTLHKGAGYVFGLKIGGDTFRTIQQPCVIIGSATQVQARVTRRSDAATIVDWTRVSSGAVTGAQTFDIPGVPVGFDYDVELRREDDTSVVAINRARVRVGYKFALMGQSQCTRLMVGDTGPGSATVSLPSVRNLTFAVHRPAMKKARNVDIHVLEAVGDMSYGLVAYMERLGTLAPTVPFMMNGHFQSGESLGSFYADQVVYSGTSYKAFGDYSTPGVGLITDMLLAGGKDISAFIHDHGTADSGRNATYASLLNALYGGVSDGNEQFSNTPSQGGPNVNPTTIVRNYTAAGLDYPIRVIMIPISRHAYVTTGAGATQVSFDSFRSNYDTLRKNQEQWSPPVGITMQVGAQAPDIQLLDSSETAHQTLADVRGNIRHDLRVAMATLRAVGGLTTYDPEFVGASVARATNVLTVSFTRPNAGAIFTPASGAPTCFEVDNGGVGTWSKAGGSVPFTAAIAGNTVTLTKSSGNWTASSKVRIAYGGPIEYFTVSQNAGTRTTNFGLENTDLDNYLYETRTDAEPSSGSGYVQGVPVRPTFTDLVSN